MKYRERFLRHEMKYIITPGIYQILRSRFRAAMKLDENGEYRVTSLYFDDVYRSAYNDKLTGLLSRRKYRIRSYNLSDKRITLEAKYKDSEYVSKLSAPLKRDEYGALLRGDFSLGFSEAFAGTALEEMAVSNAVCALRPSVLVDYFREPYVSRDGNVRLTFDKSLSTSYDGCDMFGEGVTFSPVLGNSIIFEIKFDGFMPVYVEEMISGLPLTRESVSKFVLCTEKFLEVKYHV